MDTFSNRSAYLPRARFKFEQYAGWGSHPPSNGDRKWTFFDSFLFYMYMTQILSMSSGVFVMRAHVLYYYI